MTLSQLRDDFEKAFSSWELDRTRDDKEYLIYATQAAWLAWVSSYETYVGPVSHSANKSGA